MTELSDQAQVADELQHQLRDLLCLAVAGDHIRWVVAGNETAGLAGWLRDASTQWREWAEQVAGRLAALGVAPDGRVRSLVKEIPLNWVPPGWLDQDEARRLVAGRLRTVSNWARYRRSQATDPVTVRLLDTVCDGMGAQLASFPTETSRSPSGAPGAAGTAASPPPGARAGPEPLAGGQASAR